MPNKIKIERIDNFQLLLDVFKFLELSSNTERKKLNNLLKYILSSNENYPIYGFVMFNKNNEICGAIITILQGKVIHAGNKLNVINLSTWYVKNEYRGINSIKFIKFVVDYFKEDFITNYLPSNEVLPIYLRLGFKRSKSVQIRSSILSCFTKRPDFGIKLNLITLTDEIKKYIHLNEFSNLELSSAYQVNIKNKSFILIGTRRYIKRKFLHIPIFHILWNSDNLLLAQSWNNLVRVLIIKNRVMGIYNDFSSSNLPSSKKSLLNFDFKFNTNYLHKSDLNFIEPIGSELHIF